MKNLSIKYIPIQHWCNAARPKTLFASIGPVILGCSIAYYDGYPFNFTIAFLTLFCTLLLQIGTNYTNDYYDYINGTDKFDRIGPTRLTQSGLISAKDMKKAFLLCYSLAALVGVLLMLKGGAPIIIIGATSILAAFAYTGGPYPLSYYALGEVLAFLFFGPIALWGTYYLQTDSHSLLPLFVGCGPGLISCALMAINNLRDKKSDEKTRKVTLAVILNEKGARLVALLPLLLSSLLPFFLAFALGNIYFALAAITFYVFLPKWKFIATGKIDENLNSVLESTGKYLFLFCFFLSIIFIICK